MQPAVSAICFLLSSLPRVRCPCAVKSYLRKHMFFIVRAQIQIAREMKMENGWKAWASGVLRRRRRGLAMLVESRVRHLLFVIESRRKVNTHYIFSCHFSDTPVPTQYSIQMQIVRNHYDIPSLQLSSLPIQKSPWSMRRICQPLWCVLPFSRI